MSVYKARHINDCFAVFDLLRDADRPVIAFCMGAAGQITRILAKKFGAFLTFASLDADAGSTHERPVSLGRAECGDGGLWVDRQSGGPFAGAGDV
ncbi:MAG: type I 3-dehydroquinate dehydratase [Planctomycetota bacterium]